MSGTKTPPSTTEQGCYFCGATGLRVIRTISRAKLLSEYRTTFGLTFPVSVLESNFAFDSIATCECQACGSITFRPQILGDGEYYDFLSKHLGFYYPENAWEYPVALELLEKERVKQFLEIGCGNGHFLKLARNRNIEGHGNELNPQAVERLKSFGFEVLTDLPRDLINREYEAVVMFQVLEHLLDPFSFLTDLLPHVRSGGLIILSTPVTPSCSASVARTTLHMPPHHQTLPTASGFRRLAERLGCECECVLFNPPDVFQVQFGLKKIFGWLPAFDNYSWTMARLTLKAAQVIGCHWASVGHTVLVVFRVP